MINGAHIILYSTDAEADRVFIRDVLGFAGVDANIYTLGSKYFSRDLGEILPQST